MYACFDNFGVVDGVYCWLVVTFVLLPQPLPLDIHSFDGYTQSMHTLAMHTSIDLGCLPKNPSEIESMRTADGMYLNSNMIPCVPAVLPI